jgi:hypothetical protein
MEYRFKEVHGRLAKTLEDLNKSSIPHSEFESLLGIP